MSATNTDAGQRSDSAPSLKLLGIVLRNPPTASLIGPRSPHQLVTWARADESARLVMVVGVGPSALDLRRSHPWRQITSEADAFAAQNID